MDWVWGPAQAAALQRLKAAVSVLWYYNAKEEVTLQCDTSQTALGASLLQNDQPVVYASRVLTDIETCYTYAQIERATSHCFCEFSRQLETFDHTDLLAMPSEQLHRFKLLMIKNSKFKKMVDRAIKVAILEGDFAAICDLGFPLALSPQLQTNALKLYESLWTAKSSGSGFSVSLFWPSTKVSHMKSPKKNRRHGRNSRTTTKVQSSPSENQSVCSDSHHNTDSDAETEPEVDLLSCTEVAYENSWRSLL